MVRDNLLSVSLGWRSGRCIIQFLFDSLDDCSDATVRLVSSKFLGLLDNDDEKVVAQVFVGDISFRAEKSPDYSWASVFGRRVYFDDELDYFTEESDYHRFLEREGGTGQADGSPRAGRTAVKAWRTSVQGQSEWKALSTCPLPQRRSGRMF